MTEVWRRGSVIGSWLLDLTAEALFESPTLDDFSGRVSDSGEGRWTSLAAIDEGVPAPVLTTALYSRFASRGLDDYADKVLSAMRMSSAGTREGLELTATDQIEREKQLAAEAAAQLVENGMMVGLGTGSTAAYLLPPLAARKLDITCVATSPATSQAARALGIEVVSFAGLEAPTRLDVTIDGADQVDPAGWLVKGGGAAHTREKAVAAAADRFIVIVSSNKVVERLTPPIPLELAEFGLAATFERVQPARLRDVPRLRVPQPGRRRDRRLPGGVRRPRRVSHLALDATRRRRARPVSSLDGRRGSDRPWSDGRADDPAGAAGVAPVGEAIGRARTRADELDAVQQVAELGDERDELANPGAVDEIGIEHRQVAVRTERAADAAGQRGERIELAREPARALASFEAGAQVRRARPRSRIPVGVATILPARVDAKLDRAANAVELRQQIPPAPAQHRPDVLSSANTRPN